MFIKLKNEEKRRTEFFKVLKKYVEKVKGFSLQLDYMSNKEKVDCCISDSRGMPFAIIEFKAYLNGSFARKIGKQQLRQNLKLIKAKYALLTDSKKFYLCKNVSENSRFEKITFVKFLKTLFPKVINKLLSENYRFIKNKLKENNFDVSRMSQKDVVLKNDSLFFSKKFEKKFVNYLPSFQLDKNIICRYVSLETAFEILKNKKIRMNGIIGMNDSTESDFFEKILYDGIVKTADLREIANNIYIMSCSTEEKIDNLTQWRLYGDDARGVCLVFEVKKNTSSSNFKLGKIFYENPDNLSKEILNMKRLLDSVYKETLIPFMFRNFHEWAHFYKPKDYESESEVRLLYINKTPQKKKWFLSKPLNVVNSYVEISLEERDFPLKLSQIYLGPKCPESEVNQSQFKTMLNEFGREDVDVLLSDVDCYR